MLMNSRIFQLVLMIFMIVIIKRNIYIVFVHSNAKNTRKNMNSKLHNVRLVSSHNVLLKVVEAAVAHKKRAGQLLVVVEGRG